MWYAGARKPEASDPLPAEVTKPESFRRAICAPGHWVISQPRIPSVKHECRTVFLVSFLAYHCRVSWTASLCSLCQCPGDLARISTFILKEVRSILSSISLMTKLKNKIGSLSTCEQQPVYMRTAARALQLQASACGHFVHRACCCTWGLLPARSRSKHRKC